MDARRTELSLSWREVATAADITAETLRAIRRGSNHPSALTQRGIERALQWTAGSLATVLNGGQPRIAPRMTAAASDVGFDPLADLPYESHARFAELLRRQRAIYNELARLGLPLDDRSET